MSEVTDFTALPLNLELSHVGLHRFEGSVSRVFDFLVFCFLCKSFASQVSTSVGALLSITDRWPKKDVGVRARL